jgi:hypothetical protein
VANPVVGYLQRRDKAPAAFANQVMLTGISGTAVKPGKPAVNNNANSGD